MIPFGKQKSVLDLCPVATVVLSHWICFYVRKLEYGPMELFHGKIRCFCFLRSFGMRSNYCKVKI